MGRIKINDLMSGNVKALFFILIFIFPVLGIAKDMYIWVDNDGVKHYSQTPPRNKAGSPPVKKEKLKKSAVHKPPKKYNSQQAGNNRKDCTTEPEPGWDAATLKTINNNYNYYTKGCKDSFKRGYPQLKVCLGQYEEKKEKSMKSYRETIKSRCK